VRGDRVLLSLRGLRSAALTSVPVGDGGCRVALRPLRVCACRALGGSCFTSSALLSVLPRLCFRCRFYCNRTSIYRALLAVPLRRCRRFASVEPRRVFFDFSSATSFGSLIRPRNSLRRRSRSRLGRLARTSLLRLRLRTAAAAQAFASFARAAAGAARLSRRPYVEGGASVRLF
jgi:hypothetical protein